MGSEMCIRDRIDVISPCVTFANNDESYKSYNYVKENDEVLHMLDYIPHFPDRGGRYPRGGVR